MATSSRKKHSCHGLWRNLMQSDKHDATELVPRRSASPRVRHIERVQKCGGRPGQMGVKDANLLSMPAPEHRFRLSYTHPNQTLGVPILPLLLTPARATEPTGNAAGADDDNNAGSSADESRMAPVARNCFQSRPVGDFPGAPSVDESPVKARISTSLH